MDLARRSGQNAHTFWANAPSGTSGTLDPMATGVLPLVIGKMTRLCQFYEDSEKAYEGTIRFGFATDTYDADGDPAGYSAQKLK